MRNSTWAALGLFGAGALGLYLLARRFGITADSFNIASPENVAYRGANAVVQAVTGDANQTVGGAIFDLFNPNAGLAPGEVSTGRGVIVSPVVTWGQLEPGYVDPWTASYINPLFAETNAGAVTGRTMRP